MTVTLRASHLAAPPAWALAQRHLIAAMNQAAPVFQARYTRPDGSFVWRQTWPGMDGSDDGYESYHNWPLLYALDEKITDPDLAVQTAKRAVKQRLDRQRWLSRGIWHTQNIERMALHDIRIQGRGYDLWRLRRFDQASGLSHPRHQQRRREPIEQRRCGRRVFRRQPRGDRRSDQRRRL